LNFGELCIPNAEEAFGLCINIELLGVPVFMGVSRSDWSMGGSMLQNETRKWLCSVLCIKPVVAHTTSACRLELLRKKRGANGKERYRERK
jgi:hypothetical protein